MKTLKQLLSKTKPDTRNFASPTKDEDNFVAKHEIDVVADANGNGDDVFKGTIVKPVNRSKERHGYNPGQDEKVHEATEIEEKKLTPAEMKKREEVAKAIARENPDMPMAKKMAIATATAKKVAEEVEEETTLEEDMIELYFALDEEGREQFVKILDEGTDEELLEFVQMLEEENV